MTNQFKNVFDSLPNGMGAVAQRLVGKREATGCNVHFINSQGKQDRRSFQTVETANNFAAAMTAHGLTILEGAS